MPASRKHECDMRHFRVREVGDFSVADRFQTEKRPEDTGGVPREIGERAHFAASRGNCINGTSNVFDEIALDY
jgi:hypothetical protein